MVKRCNNSIIRSSHEAADALDWDEAMRLITRLERDKRYRDAMLIAAGCFLGLRISDLLTLSWNDLLSDTIRLNEKKTGKKRVLRVNAELKRHAERCSEELEIEDLDDFVFRNTNTSVNQHFSRQRAAQILSEIKVTYKVKSARVFSAHSLRKTFGRRVWQNECENNRGEQALVLLCDVFGHANVQITKRYLGIRQEEILSVYDSLSN